MFDKADALRRMVMGAARITGLDMLVRPLLGGVGAIIMLHRVTATPRHPRGPNRHLSISPEFLDRVIAGMKADGFVFVSMDEAIQRLRAGDTGDRFAAITADDGYRDNMLQALPVLEHHGAPMTVYIAPALIDRTVPLWWEALEDIVDAGRSLSLPGGEQISCKTEQERAEAFNRLASILVKAVEETRQQDLVQALAEQAATDPFAPGREILLDWKELRDFSRHPLITIGAHSVHHFNLRRLSIGAAVAEMRDGRRRLEAELGLSIRHFAYPYGHPQAAGPREAELAREAGFTSAVTTRHGLVQEQHIGHLHALPRISLNGRFQDLAQVRVMTRGFTIPLANRGRKLVTV